MKNNNYTNSEQIGGFIIAIGALFAFIMICMGSPYSAFGVLAIAVGKLIHMNDWFD